MLVKSQCSGISVEPMNYHVPPFHQQPCRLARRDGRRWDKACGSFGCALHGWSSLLREAKRRDVKLVILSTQRAIKVLAKKADRYERSPSRHLLGRVACEDSGR